MEYADDITDGVCRVYSWIHSRGFRCVWIVQECITELMFLLRWTRARQSLLSYFLVIIVYIRLAFWFCWRGWSSHSRCFSSAGPELSAMIRCPPPNNSANLERRERRHSGNSEVKLRVGCGHLSWRPGIGFGWYQVSGIGYLLRVLFGSYVRVSSSVLRVGF